MAKTVTMDAIYNTGSAPDEYFLYEHAGEESCVLGGGEARKRERSWVVGIISEISKSLHIPLIGVDNYLQNFLHILLGVVLGPVYWLCVRLGIYKLPRLQYDTWAIEDRKVFDAYDGKRPDAQFMRGISSAWALKIFSGAIWLSVKRFEALIIENLNVLLAKHPDTVIQFELPLEMAAGTRLPLPRWLRKRIYRAFLRSVARIIRATPPGTKFAFHLCWGDLGGHPVVPKWRQKVMAKIDMLNELFSMSEWNPEDLADPDFWYLSAIHEPYGDGDHVPTVTKRQLKQIARHLMVVPSYLRDMVYAFGVLHIEASAEQTLELVERLIRVFRAKGLRFFAIATPCGMGRMEPSRAAKLFERARTVIRLFTRIA